MDIASLAATAQAFVQHHWQPIVLMATAALGVSYFVANLFRARRDDAEVEKLRVEQKRAEETGDSRVVKATMAEIERYGRQRASWDDDIHVPVVLIATGVAVWTGQFWVLALLALMGTVRFYRR